MKQVVTILLTAMLAVGGTAFYFLWQGKVQPTEISDMSSHRIQNIERDVGVLPHHKELTENDKRIIMDSLLKQLKSSYCDAEAAGNLNEKKDDVFSLGGQEKQIYFAWWFATATRETMENENGKMEEYCSGGSGTGAFHLAKLEQKGKQFVIVEEDVFEKLDAANGISDKVDYAEQPKAINTRFIDSLNLGNNGILTIVADKYAPESENDFQGNNFPTRRWQYEVRLSDMRVLKEELLGKLIYQDNGEEPKLVRF